MPIDGGYVDLGATIPVRSHLFDRESQPSSHAGSAPMPGTTPQGRHADKSSQLIGDAAPNLVIELLRQEIEIGAYEAKVESQVVVASTRGPAER